MDRSIMKLLEEDEDETMHSGADVEALQAALNRDIGGDDASASQPSGLDSGNAAIVPHESNQTLNTQFPNWQSSGQSSNALGASQPNEQNVQHPLQQELHSSVMKTKHSGSAAENQERSNDASQELYHFPEQAQQSADGLSQGQTDHKFQISQTNGTQISERNLVPVPGTDKMKNSASEPQSLKLQTTGQQTMGTDHGGNLKNQGKQIPFVSLLPALKPHLDKDREMQLQTLFLKLRKNDLSKDQFVRLMRNIVGDQVLRLAVAQFQTQQGLNQSQFQPQTLARQHNVRIPVSATTSQFSDSHSFDPPSLVQVHTNSSHPPTGHNVQNPGELERLVDMHGKPTCQMSSYNAIMIKQESELFSNSMQGQMNQQHQHLQIPQTSFSMYGSTGGSYHPFSGANVSTSLSSTKPQSHELQTRQSLHHQTTGASQFGGPAQAMNMMNVSKFETQNSGNDPNRLQSTSTSYFTNKHSVQQNSIPWQAQINKEQTSGSFSSANYVKPEPAEQATDQQQKSHSFNPQGSSVPSVEHANSLAGNIKNEPLEKQASKVNFSASGGIAPATSVSPSTGAQINANVQGSRMPASSTGNSGRTPPKKPTVGQKKPLEALGSSPPTSSKKQKVSGAFLDQSLEQLNDVTAVSGVNLREEEEQLFSGPKEDSRVSEASRKVVQEEEERLILDRTPLQKKLAEIMAKCGLKSISHDVERCLSLCVEERVRGLVSNLIRLSKQRVDNEKSRHRTLITSDVRQQIMNMNQKAKEEWEKKQAEVEKLRKSNEPESQNKEEGDKDKDDGSAKSVKTNKEEDDKMRTNAANVAARAAVGVDDMLSKWQLMAQARQKRDVGLEAAAVSQPDKDVSHKAVSASGRSTKENKEADKRSAAATASGGIKRFGRNQIIVPQMKVTRTITIKDVIAVLEREPQMAKSILMYQLYERMHADPRSE